MYLCMYLTFCSAPVRTVDKIELRLEIKNFLLDFFEQRDAKKRSLVLAAAKLDDKLRSCQE
jgi:hypothetical protein